VPERVEPDGEGWIETGADGARIYGLEHASRVAELICIADGRIHNDRESHDEKAHFAESDRNQG
jgi:hypothetical protein